MKTESCLSAVKAIDDYHEPVELTQNTARGTGMQSGHNDRLTLVAAADDAEMLLRARTVQ